MSALLHAAFDMAQLGVAETGKLVSAGAQAGVGVVKVTAGAVGTAATLGSSDTAKKMLKEGKSTTQYAMGAILADALKVGSGGVAATVAVGVAPADVVVPLAAPFALTKAASTHFTNAETLDELREFGIRECFGVEVPLCELARLAFDVYNDVSELEQGFPFALDPEIYLDELDTKMAVYKHRSKNWAVLVIRGTYDTMSVYRDICSIVNNSYPREFVMYAARVVKFLQQEEACDVLVTGHSLGGYLAEIVATTLGLGGAGFNAPGPGVHNGEKIVQKWFCTVNHEADHIGNLTSRSHQSDPVFIEDNGILTQGWAEAHSMENMVGYMLKRRDWTNLDVAKKCKKEHTRLWTYAQPGMRSLRPPQKVRICPGDPTTFKTL